MLTRLARFGSALPRAFSGAPARFVSQSKPNEAAGSAAVTELHPQAAQAAHGEVSEYDKNPDYHGFSNDPAIDEVNMRMGFFMGISIALVLGGAFFYYLPDHRNAHWVKLEAQRLIVQREREGLPLISENYYDPETIVLPSSGEK